MCLHASELTAWWRVIDVKPTELDQKTSPSFLYKV